MTAWRRVVPAAVALAGLLTLSSAASPNLPWREETLVEVEPGRAIALGHVLAAVVGAVLVWLAVGLARGKRRAVTATIVLLAAAAVLNLAKGLDYEEAAVALSLAVILFRGRHGFARGGDAPRAALVAAVVAVGAVAAAYLLVTVRMLFGTGGPSFGAALAGAWHRLDGGGWWMHSGAPLALVLDALTLVALAAALALVHAVLRPGLGADGHSPAEHGRAAEIVAAYGTESLAPFVLREDKAFFFARGGLLAYRTLRGTAVVSSDPVGPPGAAAEILREFIAFADARGWNVVVTAASERHARDYRERLGLRTMAIGSEAIVDPRSFSLEGRPIRKVRQSLHRVERRGWSIEVVRSGELSAEMGAAIQRVQDRWAEARSSLTGFAMSLGRLWGAAEDADCLYVLARDPDGHVAGFLHFLPYAGGLSLDAMRRLGDEPNGLNEAMVVRALEYARGRGMREMSLNFAGFAHVMAAESAPTLRWRLLRLLLRAAHHRFQLERLVRFNDKFFPEWRPRFLVYSTRAQLPLAALRVLQAEAYVRPPRAHPLPARWRPLPHPAAPLPEDVTLGTVGS
jgi:lysyl-tRNA synthetase class 2